MSLSKFSSLLALEIVKSWATRRSNYIVIAPPHSNARELFHKIASKDFISSVQLNVNVRVAELDTSNFRCEASFVDSILAAWNVPFEHCSFSKDPISRLIKATELVCASGDRPIIIIHRFHEALEKLGEEIGTALRNLEHDFKLMTVVELPISLGSLRERWMNSPLKQVPFLTSDWGQGHKDKLLRGYVVDEILQMLPDGAKNRPVAERIRELSGGLPGLVEHLVHSDAVKSIVSVDGYGRTHALRICKRLLDWIDKPHDDIFKRLLIKNLSHPGARINFTSLADHDWVDILVGKNKSIECLLLAWACAAEKSTSLLGDKLAELERNFHPNAALELNQIVQAVIAKSSSNIYIQQAIDIVTEIGCCAGPYLDDWSTVRSRFIDLEKLAELSDSIAIREAFSALVEWKDLADFMCAFRFGTLTNPELRLEEFCVTSGLEKATASYLFLLRLRLAAADKLSPYLALKSVVEQPESILQVFSHLKFGIRFWRFDGIEKDTVDGITEAIGRPFFNIPKFSRLDFVGLLYISFHKMLALPAESRLVVDRAHMSQIESFYDQRKRQVHSTAVVSAAEWNSYRNLCETWIQVLSSVSANESSSRMIYPLHSLNGLVTEFLLS